MKRILVSLIAFLFAMSIVSAQDPVDFLNTFAMDSGILNIKVKTYSAAPTATDCDVDGERGRIAYRVDTKCIYWCDGASGWQSSCEAATDLICIGCVATSDILVSTFLIGTGLTLTDLCGGANPTVLGEVCAYDGGTGVTWQAGGGGVGYDELLDEASGLTKRAQLNMIGAGVSCVDNAGATRTDCTISAGGTHPVNMASDVTGTLPIGNGGTGLASASDDEVMVSNGSIWEAKALPDCDSAGDIYRYDAGANAFSCPNAIAHEFAMLSRGVTVATGKGPGSVDLATVQARHLPVGAIFNRIDYRLSTFAAASASGSIAIYSHDGATKYIACNSLDWSSGGGAVQELDVTVDCDAAGNVTLEPGIYNLWIGFNDATVRFYGSTSSSINIMHKAGDISCTTCQTSPATITPLTGSGLGDVPALYFYLED